MKASNYDGRTALHLAASEGHLPCVKFLVETCQLNPLQKDRLVLNKGGLITKWNPDAKRVSTFPPPQPSAPSPF